MSIYGYILVMALVTYAIRVIPLTVLRKPIKNRFLKSFLYYVPYITLAVMTFPSILTATSNPVYGGLAFIIGLLLAWFNGNLFVVEIGCVIVVLVCHFIA